MQPRLLSVEETVEIKLLASGERDRLKRLTKERLEEAGWTDEVKELCREFVGRQGIEGARHADIVAAVKPLARPKVPDNLKAELLKRIREVLEAVGPPPPPPEDHLQ